MRWLSFANMFGVRTRHHKMSNIVVDIMKKFISISILLQVIANCGFGAGALRSVKLVVDPPAVRRGQHATLRCLYNLDGSPLYSLKFYRGLREFYRFSPSELPNSKLFPFPGINVDMSLSNASQVVIKNVGFGLSGNFSCEVTADAPSFSTAAANMQMQVVELPEARPTLWTENERYEPGDVLRANCSSPPSRPKAELTFTLNNMVIQTLEPQILPTIDNLYTTRISLRLHLQSSHFGGPISSTGGGLLLRCTAQIGNLYQEYAEIELGIPQRDPIPARVTSTGDAVKITSTLSLQLIFVLSSFLQIVITRSFR